MMKLAIFAVLLAASTASLISTQRALIHHHTLHGYGNGVSSRYFDKAEHGLGYGLGYGLGAGRLGGLYNGGYLGGRGYGGYGVAYDGVDNLGLAYNNYDLGAGRLGLGRVGLGYGLGGLGYLY